MKGGDHEAAAFTDPARDGVIINILMDDAHRVPSQKPLPADEGTTP
ncbi:Hypothetical protein A7982_01104 [Minicystis rosea]|nr:Hypothetical protein A7982_01104 [Minicystis rosea]